MLRVSACTWAILSHFNTKTIQKEDKIITSVVLEGIIVVCLVTNTKRVTSI